jgi:hypothetical protein
VSPMWIFQSLLGILGFDEVKCRVSVALSTVARGDLQSLSISLVHAAWNRAG